MNWLKKKNDLLSFVEADLQDENSWLAACDGVESILHIASPIPPHVPKDDMEIIKPAVEGTVNVLNAALKKGVKKVVVTSSCLALLFGNEGKTLTEDNWSNPDKCAGYPKSKVLAEKAVWEFYEKNKGKIEICTVLPSLIFGPVFASHGNASEGLMKEFINNTFPGIPNPDCNYLVVDVRDVALGHVQALFSPNSNGKRYIIANTNVTIEDLIGILRSKYGKLGYVFPFKKVTAQEIKDSGNEVAQRCLMLMGKKMDISNQRGIQELNMTYRKIEDTILEMGDSLIEKGIAKKNIIFNNYLKINF